MNNPWAGPRVRTALDQLAIDRQRLVKDTYELAASFEDGAAGRSKGSWLAAKYCEHFASYLAAYDPGTMAISATDSARLISEQIVDTVRSNRARRLDWTRWRRFLRKQS